MAASDERQALLVWTDMKQSCFVERTLTSPEPKPNNGAANPHMLLLTLLLFVFPWCPFFYRTVSELHIHYIALEGGFPLFTRRVH